MTPYFATIIPREDQILFERIQNLFRALPDISVGTNDTAEKIEISCHLLVRAFGKVLNLAWEDGFFATFYCHSWLRTPSGHIFDVYPVGILGGPLWIASTNVLSPGRRLYKKSRRAQGNFSKPWFRRSVRILVRELQKTI